MKGELVFVLGMILFSNMVLADNQINNLAGIDLGGNMVGGGEILANFSFDYWSGNENGSEFILRLEFESNDSGFAVDRGDFVVVGYVEKCKWNVGGSCLFPRTVDFECSDEEVVNISFSEGVESLDVLDGEFYCYSEEAFLELDEHDNVFLEIVPHVAIWPGTYNLSAEVYYLSDEYDPIVKILNWNDSRYYREVDSVEVEVEISDSGDIVNRWVGSGDWSISFVNVLDDVYYFSGQTDSDIVEGDYDLVVYAEDSFGNVGNDSVVLKVDRSGPEIELLSPTNGTVYGENDTLIILANVTDVKSDVDEGSVVYRLKEQGCEDGFNLPECYDTGWQSLGNVYDSVYGVNISVSEIGVSAELNLQIEAMDNLGNEGALA